MRYIIIIAVIIVLALAAGGLIMFANVNRFKPSVPDGIESHKGVEYMRYNGAPMRLDLYAPKGTGSYPVIVWFHSGAWNTLDRSCVEQGVMDQVKRGWAVASVEYSLSMRAKWPAQLVEARAAVRWLRAHAGEYRLDTGKFIAWGMSSGGHLAAMLGVTGGSDGFDGEGAENLDFPCNVQAVVVWCAPVDLALLRGNASRAAAALLGEGKTVDPERAKAADPIAYVDANTPPFFIASGDRDDVVGLEQGELLFDSLRDAGIRVSFKIYPGYGHTDKRFNLEENFREMEAFIDSIE
jgi:acetyl esterase/lipase